MKTKRSSPVQRLVAAMDRCAIARGEAQWTNGYRAAMGKFSDPEETRLHPKEMEQWKAVDRVERAFAQTAKRILRDARRGTR